MNLVKMAWRNVWRNHRRSGITIAAMTLALFVELLYSGMVTGLVDGMAEDATAMELGDVQVFAEGYLTRPSLYETVPGHEQIIEELEGRGYHATSRLYAGGLGASGELSAGVRFIGIDPVKDPDTMDLDQAVMQGQWLDDSDPKGVIVGGGLARTLDLDLGDEVVVLSQATDGSMANDLFQVRGILGAVGASLDRGAILMPQSTFRELMVFPEGAHKVFVRKPLGVNLAQAAADVRAVAGVPEPVAAAAGAASGAAAAEPFDPAASDALDVMTWKEVSPFLSQYIDTVASVVVVFYLIIYLAVAILILNAMLMAVFERIREFGVLKAIGYGPGQVMGIMLLEGVIQATVATALGALLAAPGMWYLQNYGINVGVLGGMEMAGMVMPTIWQGHYSTDAVLVPVVMLFVISILAVIYPAAKAARVSPVEAMHHQ